MKKKEEEAPTNRRLTREQMIKAFNQQMQDQIDGTTPRLSMSEVETKFRKQVDAGEVPDYGAQMTDFLLDCYDKVK
jgi:tRNA A37 threonylcarbamoyladenosine dehydratase